MGQSVQDGTDYVHEKGQWTMGIAALRRVRGLVDGVEEEERFKRVAARALAIFLAVLLLAALATLIFSPSTIQSIFRLMS